MLNPYQQASYNGNNVKRMAGAEHLAKDARKEALLSAQRAFGSRPRGERPNKPRLTSMP